MQGICVGTYMYIHGNYGNVFCSQRFHVYVYQHRINPRVPSFFTSIIFTPKPNRTNPHRATSSPFVVSLLTFARFCILLSLYLASMLMCILVFLSFVSSLIALSLFTCINRSMQGWVISYFILFSLFM